MYIIRRIKEFEIINNFRTYAYLVIKTLVKLNLIN